VTIHTQVLASIGLLGEINKLDTFSGVTRQLPSPYKFSSGEKIHLKARGMPGGPHVSIHIQYTDRLPCKVDQLDGESKLASGAISKLQNVFSICR
jgi:hypothetical protein